MSEEAVLWAWDQLDELGPGGPFVTLMMLARNADRLGRTQVTRPELSEWLDCEPRTITRHTTKLQAAGLLAKDRESPGGQNAYQLAMPQMGEDSAVPRDRTDRSVVVAPPTKSTDKENQETLEGVGDSTPPLRKHTRVGRHVVNAKEWRMATAILARFNQRAEKNWSALTERGDPSPHVKPIIARIREHPELDLADHYRIVANNLQNPWWEGKPAGIGVIYGEKAFQRCIPNTGRPTGKRRFEAERDVSDDPDKPNW